VLLGPPGTGKSTLTRLLFNALGACPLSTGDLFRAARGRMAPPGSAMVAAQAQLERGELVPDEIMLELVRERCRCLSCLGGFVLDGFPRTLAQARALDTLLAFQGLALDAVLSLELPHAALLARLSGRRICARCKAEYHLVTERPRGVGVCNECQGSLVQAPEDHAEAICARLADYASVTGPVAEHYRQRGLLLSITGSGRPVDTLAHALDGLAALGVPSSTRT
jgi:adenylate kinase